MSEQKKRSAMPPKNTPKNDLVMTPDYLAHDIVNYFQPWGYYLDPCLGDGSFFRAVEEYHLADKQGPGIANMNWCEVNSLEPRDFFTYSHSDFWMVNEINPGASYDWIISNPPYSLLTPWLERSFQIALNVVYLIQPPGALFTARLRAATDAGFGIREIYRVDCPDEWRKKKLTFGAGLGAVHWQFGWQGDIRLTDGRKNKV